MSHLVYEMSEDDENKKIAVSQSHPQMSLFVSTNSAQTKDIHFIIEDWRNQKV